MLTKENIETYRTTKDAFFSAKWSLQNEIFSIAEKQKENYPKIAKRKVVFYDFEIEEDTTIVVVYWFLGRQKGAISFDLEELFK